MIAAALLLGLPLVTLPGSGHAEPVETLWGSAAPAAQVDSDTAAVELGTVFTAAADGKIRGARYYRDSSNAGPHIANLWSASGTRLATAAFDNETSSGWQLTYFPSPVDVFAGRTYIVSYHAPRGRYVSTTDWRGSSVSASLKVDPARIGVYKYGSASAFPSDTWRNSNYFVDTVFESGATTGNPVTPSPTPTQTPTQTQTPTPSPTPTPTPTATGGTRTGCAPLPSACGYPDATNTGPARSTTYTKVPSQRTSGAGWTWSTVYSAVVINTAGAVVSGLDVNGGVLIDAPSATLTNSIVSACGNSWDSSDVVGVRYRPSDGFNGQNARIINKGL